MKVTNIHDACVTTVEVEECLQYYCTTVYHYHQNGTPQETPSAPASFVAGSPCCLDARQIGVGRAPDDSGACSEARNLADRFRCMCAVWSLVVV